MDAALPLFLQVNKPPLYTHTMHSSPEVCCLSIGPLGEALNVDTTIFMNYIDKTLQLPFPVIWVVCARKFMLFILSDNWYTCIIVWQSYQSPYNCLVM